jgi:NAD(P)-dependent dehydrogenase (short-subunit alcohol dehydrogenase family)
VLLQLVTLAWNVGGHLDAVGQAHTSDLAQRRVRLLGSCGTHDSANAALLGSTLGLAQYGASKAAIMNLTQVAAIEYAPDGIRVNCIAPGMHKSELGSQNRPRTPDPEMEKRMQGFIADYCKQWIPLGRQADAEELTGLAVLLASDASGYITGQVFAQDGGQSARL